MVPADHKWFARVVIGSAIVSALEKLDLKFPKVDAASLQEFKKVRQALQEEGKGGAKKVAPKTASKAKAPKKLASSCRPGHKIQRAVARPSGPVGRVNKQGNRRSFLEHDPEK